MVQTSRRNAPASPVITIFATRRTRRGTGDHALPAPARLGQGPGARGRNRPSLWPVDQLLRGGCCHPAGPLVGRTGSRRAAHLLREPSTAHRRRLGLDRPGPAVRRGLHGFSPSTASYDWATATRRQPTGTVPPCLERHRADPLRRLRRPDRLHLAREGHAGRRARDPPSTRPARYPVRDLGPSTVRRSWTRSEGAGAAARSARGPSRGRAAAAGLAHRRTRRRSPRVAPSRGAQPSRAAGTRAAHATRRGRASAGPHGCPGRHPEGACPVNLA